MYGNLKDQMKLDLCICEALSYMHVTMETVFVGMAINYPYYLPTCMIAPYDYCHAPLGVSSFSNLVSIEEYVSGAHTNP